MGIFGLRQLVLFSELFPKLCCKLIRCGNMGDGTKWFPFAITGITVSNTVVRLVQSGANSVPNALTHLLMTYSHYTTANDTRFYLFVGIVLYAAIFTILESRWSCLQPPSVLHFSAIFSKTLTVLHTLDRRDLLICNTLIQDSAA
uniref:ELMO domain-containing protein B n=1 Tax=Lygus hesperus TaxID=30085 RepID=A0A0A9WCR8_LYGHE